MEGPLLCNTFYPNSNQGTSTWLLDSLHTSQAWKKTEEDTQYTCEPLEISDTYSGLQMSAILMNTPRIKILEIRFLTIALKSQYSLAEVVLQNIREIDLLIPEQGETWSILNEMWFLSKYLQLG